jgi:hypothetical protein
MPGVEAPAAVLQLARELSERDAATDIDTAYSSDKQPHFDFAGSVTCLHQLYICTSCVRMEQPCMQRTDPDVSIWISSQGSESSTHQIPAAIL